jgi:glycosyltransferase involved in cell wall biosynthesis
VLQALALLPKEVDWRFHHIGGGPLLDDLKSLAETLQIAKYIRWQGSAPQETVLEAYRDADIFVLASCIAGDGDRDGLPNVLMEAQSQKLAVVATAFARHRRLVVPGETGCWCRRSAPENLSGALLRLIRDPGTAAALGGSRDERVRRGVRAGARDRRSGAQVQGRRMMYYLCHPGQAAGGGEPGPMRSISAAEITHGSCPHAALGG